MWLLGKLAAILRWLEELLIIVSGPLLTFGLGIALVDLLTDGALLTTQPGLLYAWAISQAAGVDAQLVGSAAKVARHAHEGHPWRTVGYGVLIIPLAYVAYLASNVFATQEAQGVTTGEALARLGMDGTTWILQRSALAVLLVILSGLLRYVPDKAVDAADERAQLEREAEIEPLRQQVRAARALGMVGLVRQMIAAARGEHAPAAPAEASVRTPDAPPVRTQAETPHQPEPDPPPDPPTDGGTPGAAQLERETPTPEPSGPRGYLLALPAPRHNGKRTANGAAGGKRETARERKRRGRVVMTGALLTDNPRLSARELRAKLRCRMAEASELWYAWHLAHGGIGQIARVELSETPRQEMAQ